MAPDSGISPEKRVVRLVYRDSATFDEWVQTMDAVLRDSRFQPGFSFLVDRRGAPPPSRDYVERMVHYTERHQAEIGASVLWATVVSDKVSYGMARMAQGLSGSSSMHVFTDVAQAEKWLFSAEGTPGPGG